ncbi:glucanotransferase domain of glycogen debranching enzyme-domain-containing protein [Blastocladiella britannica]|nr:glucanotransferase domain of glycogen debranching enzyme-domain-containing protein [Blastocladiella britannica]
MPVAAAAPAQPVSAMITTTPPAVPKRPHTLTHGPSADGGSASRSVHHLPAGHVGPIIQFKLEPPRFSVPLVRLPPREGESSLRLRFLVRAGARVLSHGARLVTNYPFGIAGADLAAKAFARKQFRAIEFDYDFVNDAFVEFDVCLPGAFEYYIEHGPKDMPFDCTEPGYLLVEPSLMVHSALLPSLDAIALQTIVPKWLGPLSQWDSQLQVLSHLHFNMVHFVPMQVRGISNSPYSLYDQLDLDPSLFDGTIATGPEHRTERFDALSATLSRLRDVHGILGMTDVVWNHTACNSLWLRAHPESGYNLVNSPHLLPAYELDEAILEFSHAIHQGERYPGIPANPKTEDDLNRTLASFREGPFARLKLWEYYVVDVLTTVSRAMAHVAALPRNAEIVSHSSAPAGAFDGVAALPLAQRAERLKRHALTDAPFGTRYPKRMAIETCVAYLDAWAREGGHLTHRVDPTVADATAADATGTTRTASPSHALATDGESEAELVRVLNEINLAYYATYDDDVASAFSNIANTVRWQRLAPDGPKLGPISAERPLVWSYFTRGYTDEHGGTPASKANFDPAKVWANNGWIWGANPLVDFASSRSRSYLRREVIVWGDCVKLRFGNSRDDSPWLWDHMAEYTRLMAEHFDAFRIDNCHSTPIHVAQYLLDVARRERPNLYVVAELFTGDAEVDRVFVAKLGINSLIREAMQAWDSKELSRLIHRYSGDPVGSFRTSNQSATHCMTHPHEFIDVRPSEPHALFMDCTHDNEPPAQKRMVEDTVSNAALVAMTCCGMGSVLGYDFCIPENLNIVTESRQYPKLSDEMAMHPLRKALNELHQRMATEHFTEVYVHHEGQWVIVYRQDSRFHRGVVLIARTGFKNAAGTDAPLNPVILKRTHARLITAQGLERITHWTDHKDGSEPAKYIEGVPVKLVDYSDRVRIGEDENGSAVIAIDPKSPPGAIFLFDTWIGTAEQLQSLHELETLEGTQRSGIGAICSQLTLHDLSVLMYQATGEEQEHGGGMYDIPGYGPLAYCGVEGIASVLRPIMQKNDLGHALCSNLREGPWLMDYTVNRLEAAATTGRATGAVGAVAEWLKVRFDLVKIVPQYLQPKYFSVVLMSVVVAAREAAITHMSHFVKKSPTFVRQLAMTSMALTNIVKSASLSPTKSTPALAAGLPHFATNHMRCWGRDVFISLKGMYMLTGQLDHAKAHILGFGSTMRHGLIPNLLDSGRFPRYNARDAVWWFLQSVQDYCHFSSEGTEFLQTPVPRRFPGEEWVHWDDPSAFSKTSTVLELVLETMQRHALGIYFREWNAGPNLDHAMHDEGFQVDAYIDWTTGFVQGGNKWNCGTWMDKMGDSHKAGNFGIPATPRDGAAIELQGLLASTLTWLESLYEVGAITQPGVEASAPFNRVVTWREWSALHRKSFNLHFYVPTIEEQPGFEAAGARIHDGLVQRRGIFKDTYGSVTPGADYQFRPNQFIAMAVAPGLFNEHHALSALKLGMQDLAGPMGMRTLDPLDPAYRGDYDNGNDGTDRTVAHGWNYHQGPEWLYPTGHFLQAYLHFVGGLEIVSDDEVTDASTTQLTNTLQTINSHLLPLRMHVNTSQWAGLPELTNRDGAECHGSCPTQAWSSATMLELEWAMFKQRESRMQRSLTIEMERACRMDD